VTIGGSNMWVVETGLKTGDKVIVDGLSKLHPGAPIKLGSGVPPAVPAGDAPKPAAAAKS